jgi:hypothetical protein
MPSVVYKGTDQGCHLQRETALENCEKFTSWMLMRVKGRAPVQTPVWKPDHPTPGSENFRQIAQRATFIDNGILDCLERDRSFRFIWNIYAPDRK